MSHAGRRANRKLVSELGMHAVSLLVRQARRQKGRQAGRESVSEAGSKLVGLAVSQ